MFNDDEPVTCDDGETLRCTIVLDDDRERRSKLADAIAVSCPVRSMRSVDRLLDDWPEADSTLLVLDTSDVIDRLVEAMDERGTWLPLIAYHPAPEVDRVVSAIAAGAIDYWEWPVLDANIVKLIETAIGRSRFETLRRQAKAAARNRYETLTPRERQVIGCLTMGYSNKEVGRSLGISPRTVEIHRANMMDKLSARSVADAVRIAVEAEIS